MDAAQIDAAQIGFAIGPVRHLRDSSAVGAVAVAHDGAITHGQVAIVAENSAATRGTAAIGDRQPRDTDVEVAIDMNYLIFTTLI